MNYFELEFTKTEQQINLDFEKVVEVSDGGFERGYAAGYVEGHSYGYDEGHEDGYSTGRDEGYNEGHNDGLAERAYEIWTITLEDGTVIEKEVALI